MGRPLFVHIYCVVSMHFNCKILHLIIKMFTRLPQLQIISAIWQNRVIMKHTVTVDKKKNVKTWITKGQGRTSYDCKGML